MRTAFYIGRLAHARMKPRHHRFSYSVLMPFVDVESVQKITEDLPFWSVGRWGLARFVRNDFIGDEKVPIAEAVKQRIHEVTGQHFEGQVFLLDNWRYFGIQNNPIACYFCKNHLTDELEYIVAEVTNTPWGERHSYVLPVDAATGLYQTEFDKKLHVSPFHGMNQRYRWFSTTPDDSLAIKLTNLEDGERVFHASLTLKRLPLNKASALTLLARFPLETAKVAAAIYWQALVLFLRRVPLYSHPKNDSAH